MKTLQSVGIAVLKDRILPYAGAIDLPEAERLATSAGGLILSGRSGLRTVRRLREIGYDGVLLLDPAEYALANDRSQDLTLFEAQTDWPAEQNRAGVTALMTACPVIPAGDSGQLSQIISDGNRLALRAELPSITVLALPRQWLTPRHLDELLRGVERSRGPLALAFGDSNDPLGTEAAIGGLLRVMGATTSSGLIRTDIAGLGALAHDALFSAIGLGTTHRHFVPPGKRAGGNRRDRSIRLFVPGLLSFRTAEHLASTAGRDQSGVLDCHCEVCGGNSLDRFEDDRLRQEARVHDVLSWRVAADQILSVRTSSRKAVWRQLCHEAVEAHQRLEEDSRVMFSPPSHLMAWARFSAGTV